MKEPKHRNNATGPFRLRNDKVLVTNVSFDTQEDAEAWGNWNNFGDGNPYEIVGPKSSAPTR